MKRYLPLLCSLMALPSCANPTVTAHEDDAPKAVADVVYIHGDIVTVNASEPTASAVAVTDGRISAVGSDHQVLAQKGASTRVVDLQGRTMTPGFIDGHGHFAGYFKLINLPNIASPPVGPARTIDDVVEIMTTALQAEPDTAFLYSSGYDDSLLAERRHPDREDLDKISQTVPVCLVHVSGHLATCNTPGLLKIGVTNASEDPKGGVIQRGADGEPNGILEESAMYPLVTAIPPMTPEALDKAIDQTVAFWASMGATTVQDGATFPDDLKVLLSRQKSKGFAIDVVSYLNAAYLDTLLPQVTIERAYTNRVRFGGIKIIQDGSPQGKTAYLTKPYLVPPKGAAETYRGYPIFDQTALNKLVMDAYADGYQVLTHTNGDAATDMFIESVKQAEAVHGKKDLRPVIIHAQTIREDQLDAAASLGMIPSFFVAHTYFWGDWHYDEVLGPGRAERISPLVSARKRGLRYNIHNDSPVVPPNFIYLMWTAVNRTTRSGRILGADQRVSAMEALKAITLDAAYAYHEDDQKGSIEVGKMADLVILSANPTKVEPNDIKGIQVLETIKDGESIYTRP